MDDTPESTSVDDIPINEYSDDNIDDIVEANSAMELDSHQKTSQGTHPAKRLHRLSGHLRPHDLAVRGHLNPKNVKSQGHPKPEDSVLWCEENVKHPVLLADRNPEDVVIQYADGVCDDDAQTILAARGLRDTDLDHGGSGTTASDEFITGTECEMRVQDDTITEQCVRTGADVSVNVESELKSTRVKGFQDDELTSTNIPPTGQNRKEKEKEKKEKKKKEKKDAGMSLKQRLGQIPSRLSKFSLWHTFHSDGRASTQPSPPSPLAPPPPSISNNHHHNEDTDNDDGCIVDNNETDNLFDDDNQNNDNLQDSDQNDDDDNSEDNDDKGKEEGSMAGKDTAPSDDEKTEPEVLGAAILAEEGRVGRADNWTQEETSFSVSCKKPHSAYRSVMTKVLCGLYALMVVVLAVVFSVATALTETETQHLYYLEVFLLYLYTVSVAILLFLQCYLLTGQQVQATHLDSSIRIIIQQSEEHIHLSPSPSNHGHTTRPFSYPPATPKHNLQAGRDRRLKPGQAGPLDQRSRLSNASYFRSHLLLPPDGEVAHVGEGINFYLRLGALGFSAGSVTLDGLHVASYLESPNVSRCHGHLFLPVCLTHLLFTFLNTFFLFKNHKLVINKLKGPVRLALMHLLATNLCVWFVTIVRDIAEDHHHQEYTSSLGMVSVSVAEESCYADRTLARRASPYLFPCTVIYSIIATTIIYRLYCHVGVKVKVKRRWPSHVSLTSSAAPQGVGSMDCEKANKGLFCGLLVAVVTMVSIATFFLLDSRLDKPQVAVKVFFILEISLLLLTGGSILSGYVKLQQLRFLHLPLQDSFPISLDSVLLLLALAGTYLYLGFMLLSSVSSLGGDFSTEGLTGVLSVSTILVGLLQSTLQSVFILDGLCRRADNDSQVERKPGRSMVTLVLVCNLALWLITLFEFRKIMVLPDPLNFYGPLPWNIVLHLSLPLYVYFRFHSAICLSNIWYHAYTKGG